MTNAEQDRIAKRKHYDKYETLAHRLSIPALKSIVPFTRDEINNALFIGDEHLNSLPLGAWDGRHGIVMGWASEHRIPWSLSQTVCLLKHVATYHIAAYDPPPAN